MDIRHLEYDELCYEFDIRSISHTDPDRMVLLQTSMADETAGRAEIPVDEARLTRASVSNEVKECDRKLSEIAVIIEEAIAAKNEAIYRKGHSRLMHIESRIRRLQDFAPDHAAVERLVKRALEILNKCTQTRLAGSNPDLLAIKDGMDDIAHTTGGAGAIRKNTAGQRSSAATAASSQTGRALPSREEAARIWENEPQNRSSNQGLPDQILQAFQNLMVQPNINSPPPRSQNSDGNANAHRRDQNNPFQGRLTGGHRIHQWSLRFDGEANGLDADDFIFRVERQAQLYGVSNDALVIGFGELLRGRAEQWYWTFQRQYQLATWNQLRAAFLHRHQLVQETDYDLRAKMEKRKQQPGEKFSYFCQDMEALASRLNHQMEAVELIEVLRRNMTMTLRKVMWRERFVSVNELLQCCLEYEQLCSEEEQSAQVKRPWRVHEMEYTPQHEMNHVDALHEHRQRGNTLVCFNCKAAGHTFHYCPQPQRNLFCISCGAHGVLKMDCRNCQENFQRGGMATGSRPPQPPFQHPSVLRRSQSQQQMQPSQHPTPPTGNAQSSSFHRLQYHQNNPPPNHQPLLYSDPANPTP